MSSICTECQQRIYNYGFICLDVMRTVCFHTLELNICFYDEKYTENWIKTVIKFLESKKLIVTLDIEKDKVAMRANSSDGSYDERKKLFCWCNK